MHNSQTIEPATGSQNGASGAGAQVTAIWVYYETEKTDYYWDPISKQIDITLYGTIRSTIHQNVETFLTGPINDPNPNHKPRTAILVDAPSVSWSVFPVVGSFEQNVTMNKKQWPYNGEYMLQSRYAGINSSQITFFVDSR